MIFQKPLGWVQRFLYNIEQGNIPFPQPVLPIDQDWPLTVRLTSVTSATIAGTVNVLGYNPDKEHHGLVFLCNALTTGTFPATDTNMRLFLTNSAGATIPITNWQGGAAISMIPLIAGYSAGNTGAVWVVANGSPAIYVEPGGSLIYTHTSVAGGVAFDLRLAIVERLKSYPLRLP